MQLPEQKRVGYILKRYPRYSETFVVNEILAHEEAGLEVFIYALRPPVDTHFQGLLGRVRAPVRYLQTVIKSSDWWNLLHETGAMHPRMWVALPAEGRSESRNAHQAMELARRAKADGITHFHAHFATDAAAVARLTSRITGIPYSITAHAKDIFHETVDTGDLDAKIGDASHVVTVSDYNLAFLHDRLNRAIPNLTRIYNGLDLDLFPYSEPSNREPLILGVGRLVEKKGFSYLIDACALLKERGVRFSCRIIGTGELRNELAARIGDRRVGDRVELAGPRPSSEVVDALREASVLAAPCVVGSDGNRDGLPTVLLEAMATGTPCVSTDVTGIPEAIIDGDTGFLVPQHDAETLAGALQALLTNPSQRIRFARGARALIEREFDIHRNAAEIRKLFDSGGLGRREFSTATIAEAV